MRCLSVGQYPSSYPYCKRLPREHPEEDRLPIISNNFTNRIRGRRFYQTALLLTVIAIIVLALGIEERWSGFTDAAIIIRVVDHETLRPVTNAEVAIQQSIDNACLFDNRVVITDNTGGCELRFRCPVGGSSHIFGIGETRHVQLPSPLVNISATGYDALSFQIGESKSHNIRQESIRSGMMIECKLVPSEQKVGEKNGNVPSENGKGEPQTARSTENDR